MTIPLIFCVVVLTALAAGLMAKPWDEHTKPRDAWAIASIITLASLGVGMILGLLIGAAGDLIVAAWLLAKNAAITIFSWVF